ncbi:hypothetical protein CONPUDRAFT_74298 [Coniophora puteana RWD-64-598 SS2]|uniref:Uncharacterized protein n=1 Tax=Coniophora puteana (strain RWD-64-598) TaxID=741705 RepID=A0A5M3MMK5_CONPW|nr:uncharacterized protein CONPUDRAFT_74298 [Coniophora puteana RWD-64-598 SS2]EIW80014.1 hypothetical protein CONPUDRAFT_74298 [Coniophora puteana RWD-64-598 SS2]
MTFAGSEAWKAHYQHLRADNCIADTSSVGGPTVRAGRPLVSPVSPNFNALSLSARTQDSTISGGISSANTQYPSHLVAVSIKRPPLKIQLSMGIMLVLHTGMLFPQVADNAQSQDPEPAYSQTNGEKVHFQWSSACGHIIVAMWSADSA